jgi:hypothetical protein
MQVLYPRCAGLDVHKDTIVACVRCVSAPEHHGVQSFPSTTKGLLTLSDWLAAAVAGLVGGALVIVLEFFWSTRRTREQTLNTRRPRETAASATNAGGGRFALHRSK